VDAQWIPSPGMPPRFGNVRAVGHEGTVSLGGLIAGSRIQLRRARATLNDQVAQTK
jgi:hypothetical protein